MEPVKFNASSDTDPWPHSELKEQSHGSFANIALRQVNIHVFKRVFIVEKKIRASVHLFRSLPFFTPQLSNMQESNLFVPSYFLEHSTFIGRSGSRWFPRAGLCVAVKAHWPYRVVIQYSRPIVSV